MMKKDNERKILRLLRNMEETTNKIFEVLHRIELKFIDDDIEKNSKKWEKDKNNIYESPDNGHTIYKRKSGEDKRYLINDEGMYPWHKNGEE